jgi:hypothetical protein
VTFDEDSEPSFRPNYQANNKYHVGTKHCICMRKANGPAMIGAALLLMAAARVRVCVTVVDPGKELLFPDNIMFERCNVSALEKAEGQS